MQHGPSNKRALKNKALRGLDIPLSATTSHVSWVHRQAQSPEMIFHFPSTFLRSKRLTSTPASQETSSPTVYW